MKIKHFLLVIFLVLITFSIYVNYRYLIGVEVENNSEPIKDYEILEIRCYNSSKISSSMTINYNGETYFVALSSGMCSDIEKAKIQPKLFFMNENNVVFCEGQYLPFPYVYLTYITAFLLPICGFIVYRKELNNHYSTM